MIYDITQPLFECVVFPGDPKPEKKQLMNINNGDLYNLSSISMCVHNGTHIDAPSHFIKDGKTVDQIHLSRFIGLAYVKEHTGNVELRDAITIIEKAKKSSDEAWKKILIKGDATITLEAAKYFSDVGIELIGNESQSIGPEDDPMAVHLALLEKEVVLLEGIRLEAVREGVYMLNCAPLNLTNTEGAPCRAVLIDL